MNCAEANQIDFVDYLKFIGFEPQKVNGNDCWYLSPFRDEKHASFKVERNKKVWYDHGLGKGGMLVDFVMEFYHNNVSEALQKISFFHPQNNSETTIVRPKFHLHENTLLDPKDTRETSIKIVAAKQPIEDLTLCRYLHQRRIEKSIADKYCFEVQFTNAHKEKIYKAIGFKNSAGGYELRNEYFKGSSAPKYVTYLDNKAKNIAVFEGFFDFMSYQSINQNQEHRLTNFLVLNSLSFFERSLLLMEKHGEIHLYLDLDNAGKKWLELAQKRSVKYIDKSKLYAGYKDLNEWHIKFGKVQKLDELRRSGGKHQQRFLIKWHP